jgi:hypothetical protein
MRNAYLGFSKHLKNPVKNDFKKYRTMLYTEFNWFKIWPVCVLSVEENEPFGFLLR